MPQHHSGDTAASRLSGCSHSSFLLSDVHLDGLRLSSWSGASRMPPCRQHLAARRCLNATYQVGRRGIYSRPPSRQPLFLPLPQASFLSPLPHASTTTQSKHLPRISLPTRHYFKMSGNPSNTTGGDSKSTPMTTEAASRTQSSADRGYGDTGFKARAQSAAAHNESAGQTGKK